MVAGGVDEHLRLPLQPPERLRVDDPVAVALERRPHAALAPRRPQPAARLVRAHGERRERVLLEPPDPLGERFGEQLARHPRGIDVVSRLGRTGVGLPPVRTHLAMAVRGSDDRSGRCRRRRSPRSAMIGTVPPSRSRRRGRSRGRRPRRRSPPARRAARAAGPRRPWRAPRARARPAGRRVRRRRASLGRGRPGRDRVAADPVLRVEVGDEAREREHRGLRHRVVGHRRGRALRRRSTTTFTITPLAALAHRRAARRGSPARRSSR